MFAITFGNNAPHCADLTRKCVLQSMCHLYYAGHRGMHGNIMSCVWPRYRLLGPLPVAEPSRARPWPTPATRPLCRIAPLHGILCPKMTMCYARRPWVAQRRDLRMHLQSDSVVASKRPWKRDNTPTILPPHQTYAKPRRTASKRLRVKRQRMEFCGAPAPGQHKRSRNCSLDVCGTGHHCKEMTEDMAAQGDTPRTRQPD